MPGVSTRLIAAVTLVACCGATCVLQAQARVVAAANLVGLVRDSAGAPIGGVEVWIRGTDLYTHTNDSGGVPRKGAPGGTWQRPRRSLGFRPRMVGRAGRARRPDS